MLHPIISYFQQHQDLTPEQRSYIETKIPISQIPKNTILLKEGEVSSSFYYLVEGWIRMYYLVDGVEKTTFFYEADDFVSSYESYTKQCPSKHYIQTVSDTKIAIFDAGIVAEVLQRFPEFEFLARVIMEKELSAYQEMLASFVTLNAEQRYRKLLQENPRLLQMVPQYHIATYLGVSPETLSRIRSRMKSA